MNGRILRQGIVVLAIVSAGVHVTSVRASEPPVSAAPLEQNKALVVGFFQDVLAARSTAAAPKYLRPDYIQHNPGIPGGLAGFKAYFDTRFAQSAAKVKLQVLHCVAERDLVVIHARWFGTDSSGKPVDITEFDLFRVENGLLAEHWDAIGP
jgi:predicted SnoaL-like aldol condensation-catalyzing enzyme